MNPFQARIAAHFAAAVALTLFLLCWAVRGLAAGF